MCIYHKNMQLVQFCKISTGCVWAGVCVWGTGR